MDININGGNSLPSIPEEMVFQILKELPVKDLVRFRAVSKLWCSIIDDPIFVDSHRTRSYTRTGGIGILCQYRENHRLKAYSIDPQGEGSPVPFLPLPVGFCGGNCCYDYHNHLQSVNGLVYRKCCIWNPSTRESIDLPPISGIDLREANHHDYPKNLLGFDSLTKQYKVVNVCDTSVGKTRSAEYRILTLGRDSDWRNLDSVPEKLRFMTGNGVCCVDDVIFCLGLADYTGVIVAFEVGPEKFRVIPNPGGIICSRNNYIIQVEGRLGYVHVGSAMVGEVDVDQLTNAKVIECLDYVEARDVDVYGDDDIDLWLINFYNFEAGYLNYDVEVMSIWILEDYHKQQWKKKEIFTFPSHRKKKPYDFLTKRTAIHTKPMGSIHTSEILFCSQGNNRKGDSFFVCSYYDLESKSLRMVPKLTEFPKDYQHPETTRHLRVIDFTKHVECLFRLKAT